MKAFTRTSTFAFCLLFIALVCSSPGGGPPSRRGESGARPVPGLAPPQPLTRIQGEDQYRLLINVYLQPGRGFLVAFVQPDSPTNRMVKVGNPRVQGGLEVGDLITHLNGEPVSTLEKFQDTLDQSGGEVALTVVDQNTGWAINWKTQAARVRKPVIPGEDDLPAQRRVHALLIALTSDSTIGKGEQTNLTNLEKLLRNEVSGDRLDLEIVSGSDCDARTIIAKVRQMGGRSKPGDTFFCYYGGHGAYDPNYADGDPSGGHFFWIPSGDLLRKTLFDNMLAQPGRLKVLVSDTCNVRSVARVSGRMAHESKTVIVRGPTPLEQLLLHHRGHLDVSGTSRDQYGWCNAQIGGWFTHTFGRIVTEHDEWQPFLDRLSVESNAFFLRMRRSILDNPSGSSEETLRLMRSQTVMRPAVFRKDLTRDSTIPSGPARTIQRIIPFFILRDPGNEDPDR